MIAERFGLDVGLNEIEETGAAAPPNNPNRMGRPE